ncbi:MAG: phosphoribosyltransferase family protein [bacterium]
MLLECVKGLTCALVDLVFPPRCPLCGALAEKSDEPCGDCEPRIARIPGDAFLDLPWRVWLGRARSCFAHEDPVRRALWSFKYEGNIHALRFFVDALARELGGMAGYDVITAVPMQGMRVIRRGVNAAALLARSLAGESDVEFSSCLIGRVRAVRRQVGLSRMQRMENVRGVFAATGRAREIVHDRSVLILDDVMTTGATLNECARALAAAGARSVDALTVARAL